MDRDDFENLKALQSHRGVLQKNLARTRALIETIDKTINHLKGKKKMKGKEMFVGFSVAAGKDRFGEQIILSGRGGEPIDCKVSGQDTDGALSVFEFNCNRAGRATSTTSRTSGSTSLMVSLNLRSATNDFASAPVSPFSYRERSLTGGPA
jgi:hypothetical protein